MWRAPKTLSCWLHRSLDQSLAHVVGSRPGWQMCAVEDQPVEGGPVEPCYFGPAHYLIKLIPAVRFRSALATHPFIPLAAATPSLLFLLASLLQPPTRVYPPAARATAARWCSVWPTASGTAMPQSPTRRGSSRPLVRISSSNHSLFCFHSIFGGSFDICFGCVFDVLDRFVACGRRWQARVPVHQEESQRPQVPCDREEDPGGELQLLFSAWHTTFSA